MKKRNTYIDMVRGIAALSIINIHTAFWSGGHFVPAWAQNLTLLVDVPLFFFLSGWGSGLRNADIEKTVKGIGKLWLKWIYFVVLFAISCVILNLIKIPIRGIVDFRDLIRNFMFITSMEDAPVAAGSIWFMKDYFVVLLVNTVILYFVERSENPKRGKLLYLIVLSFIFLWTEYGNYFFEISNYFLFYSFFWMLGQNRGLIKIKNFTHWLRLMVLMVLGYGLWVYLLDIPFYDLQAAKFPPSFMYGFYSMLSVLTAVYCERFIKKPNALLVHIGRNAIFYFFGQGIGGSLNYWFIELVWFKAIPFWPLKWIVALIFNICVSALIAEFLAWSYGKLETVVSAILSKKNYKVFNT